MQNNHSLEGGLIPFDRSNIDTDAILPKQYLKMLDKTGYGPFLFDDERYLDPGDSEVPPETRRVNPKFILNINPYNDGKILVARRNFGCGSSREHAVWAIRDYGIRAVIAESFGEIFFNNCLRNSIAPIILDEKNVDYLIHQAHLEPETPVRIDFQESVLQFKERKIPFSLPPKTVQALFEGGDDITNTLKIAEKIRGYEALRRNSEPWVFVS